MPTKAEFICSEISKTSNCNIFKMYFIPVISKLYIQHWCWCLMLKKHFLVLSMLKTVVLLTIFVETDFFETD